MAVNIDVIRRLASEEHGLAVLSTLRADGTVQSSVINAGVMDHPAGEGPVVALVARGGTVKLTHLRRRPTATIVFRVGWEWAAVEGHVDLAGPDDEPDGLTPAAIPGLLREVFVAAGGTHEDWDEYDRVMAAERRTAVLIRPARIYGVTR